MFEKAPLTAASPEDGPAAESLVVWHPDTFDWVRLEPDDLLGDGVEPGFFERTARVLPVDAERTPTGPELAAILSAFDAGSADAGNLVEAAAGWARLAAWVAAQEADVLCRGRRPRQSGQSPVAVRDTSPDQAPRPVGRRATTRRHHPMGQSDGASIPQAAWLTDFSKRAAARRATMDA